MISSGLLAALFVFATPAVIALAVICLRLLNKAAQSPQDAQALQRIEAGLREARERLLLMDSEMGKKVSQLQLDVIERVNQALQGNTQTVLQQLGSATKSVSETDRNMQQRMDSLQQRFADVQEGIATVKTTAGEFTTIGRELRDVLLPGGQRGNFGQVELEKILKDVFPPQHLRFQSPVEPGGTTLVDAAVLLDGKLIPIDSKFPVADFLAIKKAAGGEKVKARNQFIKEIGDLLADIESKYIRPPHTFEAAVMYIHSESVYQEAVSMDMGEGGADLFTVAQRRKVLLSSPHTLLMHLRLIYSVVKNQRLSENVSKLVEMLNNLQPALEEVKDAFGKAKKQLNFAGTNLSEAEAALSQFEQRLQGVVSLPAEAPQKIPLKSP